MNKNFVVFALVMFTLSTLATTSAPSAMADWLIDRTGTLVQVDGSILGDDDSVKQDEIEDVESDSFLVSPSPRREQEQRKQEFKKEVQKNKLEKDKEAGKKKLELQIEARKKIQEKTGQTSEYQIRAKKEGLELNQEIKNEDGKMVRKQEFKLDGEPLSIESGDGGEMVRINAVKDGRLEMVKNRVRTSTDLELKVDEKNAVSVTLPNGQVKNVRLPDQALEKLVENGVITQIEGAENSYELTAKPNGDVVYSGVEGEVEKKILGFKLKFKQKMEVAAGDSEDGSIQAGDIVSSESQETSPWRRLLERFAK